MEVRKRFLSKAEQVHIRHQLLLCSEAYGSEQHFGNSHIMGNSICLLSMVVLPWQVLYIHVTGSQANVSTVE